MKLRFSAAGLLLLAAACTAWILSAPQETNEGARESATAGPGARSLPAEFTANSSSANARDDGPFSSPHRDRTAASGTALSSVRDADSKRSSAAAPLAASRAPRKASLVARARTTVPAISVEIPDSLHLPPEGQGLLQQAAQEFHEQTAGFSERLDAPGFAGRWIDAVRASDISFRRRYGQQAWMEHHIQAHRLAVSGGNGRR